MACSGRWPHVGADHARGWTLHVLNPRTRWPHATGGRAYGQRLGIAADLRVNCQVRTSAFLLDLQYLVHVVFLTCTLGRTLLVTRPGRTWSDGRGLSPQAKGVIRELLPSGLRESVSKVRSSVAYAVSAIAHWDWPEAWPQLFNLLMGMLVSGDLRAVHGAMRVLTGIGSLPRWCLAPR